MTKSEPVPARPEDGAPAVDDDEPDEWDQRIEKTGCSEENMKLTDCYYEKKDWRECTAEMAAFKECWKSQGNDARTSARSQ